MWEGETCVAPILTFFKTKIFDSIGSVLHKYEFTKSSFVQIDLLALYQKKPSERFELSTPGLQDQCSNPWVTKAMHFFKRRQIGVAAKDGISKTFNADV